MKQKFPAVYILTNKSNTVLYTGVTSNLTQRIWSHKKTTGSFVSKYKTYSLVYYKFFDNMQQAIEFEKKVKAGARKKKISLIESMNPEWCDLLDELS